MIVIRTNGQNDDDGKEYMKNQQQEQSHSILSVYNSIGKML